MVSNWAIVIGINEYEFLQPLKYAKRDAEMMGEFLISEAKFDRIFLFTADSPPVNGKSTKPFRANLLRVLREIFATPFMKDGDNFWFFFSGHGIRHHEQDYLMPLDGDPEDVENTGIPTYLITNYLRSCGADNVVLILDACRNGGRKSGEGIGRQTEAEARQTGVISIFSCSPDQYSYELEAIEQGAFTCALIEGLGIQGRCATVERLNQYLENRVPSLVNRYRDRVRQTPYTIVEPLRRLHLILMPQHASLADIATLKNDAYHAQTDENWDLAEQLWIRVLAAASGQDADAVKALQRIAVKRHTKSTPDPSDEPNRQATQESQPSTNSTYKRETGQSPQQSTSPPPVDPTYKREFFFAPKSDEQENRSQKDDSKQSTSPETNRTAWQQSSASQPQPPIEPLSKVSPRREAESIPWRALTVVLLGYITIGSILSLTFAPSLIWSVIWAWAVIWTWAVVWIGAMAVVGNGVMAGVMAGAGAWVMAVAVAVAGEDLLKAFSKLQTFFILIGIAFVGLVLGWLVTTELR
ncbi:caspase family protein [Cyanobacteria bacterium FACHB-471]|nr:caspase family protein [Cyanobacteria bacterium FACHB-471]